jgi:hypothetical protein
MVGDFFMGVTWAGRMPTPQEFNVISICKIDVFQLTSSEKIYKYAILSFEDGKYKERAGKMPTPQERIGNIRRKVAGKMPTSQERKIVEQN